MEVSVEDGGGVGSCGTTSCTPFVPPLVLENQGLWRGGNGRCSSCRYPLGGRSALLLSDDAAVVAGVCVREGGMLG